MSGESAIAAAALLKRLEPGTWLAAAQQQAASSTKHNAPGVSAKTGIDMIAVPSSGSSCSPGSLLCFSARTRPFLVLSSLRLFEIAGWGSFMQCETSTAPYSSSGLAGSAARIATSPVSRWLGERLIAQRNGLIALVRLFACPHSLWGHGSHGSRGYRKKEQGSAALAGSFLVLLSCCECG